MKIRICYEKTEAGRYLSHLDLARTMERSLRRAKAPLAFSEGFNPHVRMAFASALAVGVTGRREYVDVELAGRVHIPSFSRSLQEAFPSALAFVIADEIQGGGKALSAIINIAVYRISFALPQTEPEKVRAGIEAVLAADELWRKPKQKPGKKTVPAKEVRGLIRKIEILSEEEEGKFILEAELMMKADGQLRPQELWEMIASAGGFEAAQTLSVSRQALLILQDGKCFSPMEGVLV
ncbi:MAG: TIGR03936 family radical SAM-associated protein [Clostridiales bacterium]|nr:TIGR03936 family radical SAM-associated protein [Clostridiales bacterium]